MKKIVLILCLLAVPGLLVPASAARAAYVTGLEISNRCDSDVTADIQSCVHYIAGVIDYHMLLESMGKAPNVSFCIPPEVSMQQAAVLVMAYMRTAPEYNGYAAAASVPMAMEKAFPCKTDQKR
jgi:hypothetical protein